MSSLAHSSLADYIETPLRFPEVAKLLKLLEVRNGYSDKWSWGAAAEYLYRALIRAYNLKDDEEDLVQLAKRRRGRKEERERAERIWSLKAERKTVPQIKTSLEAEGQHLSDEAIKSYLKTRRKNAGLAPRR